MAGRAALGISPPVPDSTLVAASPDGSRMCLAHMQVARVVCTDADGSQRTVSWDAQSSAPDDSLAGAWRENVMELLKASSLSPMTVTEVLDTLTSTLAPIVLELHVDREWRLWARLAERSCPDTTQSAFTVFSALGDYMADACIPGDVQLWEMGDGYIIGSRRGADGVPQVVKLAVRRPDGS